jgi:hypothetical protein
VLGSVIVFSAFVAFAPQIQRDWFTLSSGTFGGAMLGFFGFVAIVNLAEYFRTHYPSTVLFGKLLKPEKRY